MKLLFVGDVMLGRLVNEVLKTQPPQYPWGNVLPLFTKADRRFCNLECVVSDIGEPTFPKPFNFRSDVKNMAVLKTANISAVSLANNHVLDFGYEAMLQMLEILNQAGIAHAGAGATFSEASKPAFLKAESLKISFLSLTDNEPQWEAADAIPGVFFVPFERKDKRAQTLLETVRLAKKNSDFLIIALHWGPNWGYAPPPDHQSFARLLVDRGADVIFGHSAHVFRGIEIYKNKAILYSTGNFIDDYAVDEIERNDESFIFTVETRGNQITRLDLRPTIIKNFQARLAVGNEAENVALKMKTLSAELNTPLEWQPQKNSLSFQL